MSAISHSFSPIAVVDDDQREVKCLATSFMAKPEDTSDTSTIVSDFIRSAIAIVTGVDGVDGVTDNESGFVEIRDDVSFLSSRECLPRVVEGVRP